MVLLHLGHSKLQGKFTLLQYDYQDGQRHHSDDDSRFQVNRSFFEYPSKLSTSGTTLIENPPKNKFMLFRSIHQFSKFAQSGIEINLVSSTPFWGMFEL